MQRWMNPSVMSAVILAGAAALRGTGDPPATATDGDRVASPDAMATTAAPSDRPRPALELRELGFSILPPPTGPIGPHDAVFQPVTLMLPMRDGFAANVNVMSQPFGGTSKAYLSTTLVQAEAFGWTVIDSSHDETSCHLEATGSMGERRLHWYMRAVMQEDRVILATATALQDRWEEDGPGLRESVDSLTLTPSQ